MDQTSTEPHTPRPASPSRFTLGRGRPGGKLVACLWLWTGMGALSAVAADPRVESAPLYQQALASFNQRQYTRALTFLKQAPVEGSPAGRADAENLRGAIYLRQGRFEQARAAFAEAVHLDPSLWAARFNEAEVTFRQGRYAASREQFDALLGRTSRLFQSDERRFLQYKMLLADLCAGQEQPALDFVAQHRNDPAPPLAWYYLNAALEQRHDYPQKAEQWLAQAEARPTEGNRALYVEAFRRLRGSGGEGRVELASRRVRRAPTSEQTPEAKTTELPPGGSKPADTATVAVVQLMPEGGPMARRNEPGATEVPAFRTDAPPSSPAAVASGDTPPGGVSLFPSSNPSFFVPPVSTAPGVLARPRRPRNNATPTPSPPPSPASTPADGVTANQGGTPAPEPTAALKLDVAATPAPPLASPEFTEKYEAAYVKFLDKDYPGTVALLDEADKIQPKQPQSATLRAQIFKQDYEAAYTAFRRMDYPAALAKLDEADQAQSNYPDALNLRGLVYSKQRVYDRAEAMFKRAVEADPTLWAAKFNYAELPFNRGDYTTARSRFEDLLAETDATKRPREAELTQYKVFLTLLLEGKTDQARSFMEHFNFTSGATPAKYFCNAAMNFRAGSVDKAETWIASAKREYPAQLVSIFLESFYRLGWMTDPNNTAAAGASLAVATSSPTPGTSPATVAMMGDASNSVATAGVPPILTAVASPNPPPEAAASPGASVPPVATPSATPVASTSPAVPTGTVVPASPTAGVAPAGTPAAVVSTPVPSAARQPTDLAGPKKHQAASSDEVLRWVLVGGVLLYGLYVVSKVTAAASRRKARRAARVALGSGKPAA